MKKVAALFALALVSAALVACGDDDDGTTTTTGGEATNGAATTETDPTIIDVETDPGGGLAYTEDSYTAKAGLTRIEFENPQPVGHDADLEDESGKVVGDTAVVSESGDAGTMDPPLKPGEYVFFCSVPGHREAGMEATLTVE
jgi:plastocyanin